MVKAVVGANWGDEGKGKITDMLAEKADIIVRFQGGANAGHTIVNDYGKFALHTLPSGVFYSHTTSVIGNGVALNIPILTDEIRSITERNVPMPKILVSDRCQMVMPYHILFDQYEEERLGGKSFGSTKSGIAPFYSDKYAKIGFQVSELFDEALLQEKVNRVCEMKNVILEHLYHKPLIRPQELLDTLHGYREMIASYVCDVSAYLDRALKEEDRAAGRAAGYVEGSRPRYLSNGDVFLHTGGFRRHRCGAAASCDQGDRHGVQGVFFGGGGRRLRVGNLRG